MVTMLIPDVCVTDDDNDFTVDNDDIAVKNDFIVDEGDICTGSNVTLVVNVNAPHTFSVHARTPKI